MADVSDVIRAVADAFDSLDGLRGYAKTPEKVQAPAAVFVDLEIQFDQAMGRGTDDYTLVFRLLTGGSLSASQDKLYDVLDLVKGIDGLVDSDVVQDARLATVRRNTLSSYEIGDSVFAGVDVEVEVIA